MTSGTPEDYQAVHEIQDQVGLVPLSSYGKPYTPPDGKVDLSIDMTTPVRDQVNRMKTIEYFTLLAKLMKTNPPPPEDAPALAQFARIGRSIDLYIQRASPGASRESNWLPAPTGKFILMLRMYWPKETPPSILDGSWKPPAVEKQSGSVTVELG